MLDQEYYDYFSTVVIFFTAEEIKRLKVELEETRMERDKYENQLRAAGKGFQSIFVNLV